MSPSAQARRLVGEYNAGPAKVAEEKTSSQK